MSARHFGDATVSWWLNDGPTSEPKPHENRKVAIAPFVFEVRVSAYPGKVDTPISGLPDIGALNCASRKHPTCVVGFTRYQRIKMRKSETSDLRGFPKRICANTLSALTFSPSSHHGRLQRRDREIH